MLMLSTLLIVPLLAILGVSLLDLPAQIVALAAVGCPVGGLLRILYAVFLESSTPEAAAAQQQPYVPPVLPNYLGTPPQGSALPPAQGTPINTYRRPQRFDTGEIATPPSVTDHTTRLLDRKTDEPRQE
jgi:hypothetical protein